ncbi:MAG: UbiD family decarboxylase, partial [Planctomycetales bacterium]|nr:UbiD family decarboxylase [Planctomycetales bacterium]
PPQEDTAFGQLIHDLTGPVIPTVLPGVHGVHAVDEAGVHPLLLAVGSERYMPFMQQQRPQELLTQACAILGQGQLSLAKYLLIAAESDHPPELHDIQAFLQHLLQRADWRRDLHFHTQTTIDTLDYSGDALNAGSKLVIAAAGPPRFELARELPKGLRLPEGFTAPHLVMPGVAALKGPPLPKPSFDYDASRRDATVGAAVELAAVDESRRKISHDMERFSQSLTREEPINRLRLVIVCDDPAMVCESLANFLWIVFTRSNPATDVWGIDSFIQEKHWGCHGPLVIDARIKPHHAPVLEEDPQVTERIEQMAAAGGPLSGLF